MFDYESYKGHLDVKTVAIVRDYAKRLFSSLQQRTDATPTFPLGRPRPAPRDEVLSAASEVGLLNSRAFGRFSGEAWVKDGTGSYWRESVGDRLPLLVNGAYEVQDALEEMSEDRWVDALTGALGMYLAAMSGEEINYLHLYGVRLRIEAPVMTPWGRLRPASRRDAGWIVNRILNGEHHLSSEWWTKTAILEVPVPVSWTQREPTAAQLARSPRGLHVPLTDRDAIEPDLVCLAAILTSEVRGYGPVCWGGTYFLPFGSSGSGAWIRQDQIYESSVLSPDSQQLEHYLDLLKRRFIRSRSLAVTRTISAADRRRNPIDGVVDCVVAWECLLGRSRSELSFKIAAAGSVLLGQEGSNNADVFRELKKFYALRSSIVHGAKALGHAEASHDRERAVELTLSLMRASLSYERDVWSMDEGEIEALILGI